MFSCRAFAFCTRQNHLFFIKKRVFLLKIGEIMAYYFNLVF